MLSRCFVPRRQALFAVLLWLSLPALAQTAYIKDEMEITLRSGETTQHSIVRMLSSGTRVTVLGSNTETGYTHVRTAEGREGYVLSRFLSNQPIARDRLAAAERELARLRENNQKVASELATLRDEKQRSESRGESLSEQNQRLNSDLEAIRRTSANALNIDAENKRLTTELASSGQRVQALENDNQALRKRSGQTWFLAGAGAVTVGALLGFILPRVRWRKRSRWGDL